MHFWRQAWALVLLFAAVAAHAADIAVLRNGFEIRHERLEQRGNVTRLYFSAGPDSSYIDVATEEIVTTQNIDPPEAAAITPPVPAAPHTLTELVSAAGERHMVDPDLITSVIYAESNFNPSARSPKGAQGLMQLMPETAMRFGVKNSYQPAANIEAGSQYLRELLLRYEGDMTKALAAYNAGPERVTKYRGVPPYRETRDYVARVIRDFNCRKRPENFAAARNGVAARCPDGLTTTTSRPACHHSGEVTSLAASTPARSRSGSRSSAPHLSQSTITNRATPDSNQTSK